ncbi:MAG: dephospho-CoA kinase [Candidatus Poribacteria bacterium]|nr:dephospho-CoA kinase [Candidatus Poribacteria bacterium]
MKQLDPLNGLIIGLTGGIACGKSTVTQLLQRRGADIIDLDQIGHELLKANSPVMKQLLKTFGPEVLDLSGDVNRTKLGKIVFADPLARQQLNDIVHPEIHRISRQLAQSKVKNQADSIVVIESPLLIESGGYRSVDYVVLVSATPDQQIVRLMKRSLEQNKTMTQLDAEKRLAAQMSLKEKMAYADYIVDNQGDLTELGKQVDQLWLILTNLNS